MTGHILFAYELDGKGNGVALDADGVGEHIESEKLSWVHLDANHPDTSVWLEKEISYLDPHVVSALTAQETRPRVTLIADGAIVILRGVNLNEDSAPEDMVSIRVWIDKYRIVSVRLRKLKAIGDIEDRIKGGKGPKNSGDFICMLAENLFERMEPTLTGLEDAADDVEEAVLDSQDFALQRTIKDIRKQAIVFRRYIGPQRDAIGQLRTSDLSWLEDGHKRRLEESHNRVTRYVEDLDAMRERAQIIADELTSSLANRLNNNMYILSVIAAVFLPLGFLTGLLGINVGGIPGAENTAAFWVFCTMLAGIVGVQVYLFKRMGWF